MGQVSDAVDEVVMEVVNKELKDENVVAVPTATEENAAESIVDPVATSEIVAEATPEIKAV